MKTQRKGQGVLERTEKGPEDVEAGGQGSERKSTRRQGPDYPGLSGLYWELSLYPEDTKQ